MEDNIATLLQNLGEDVNVKALEVVHLSIDKGEGTWTLAIDLKETK